MAADPILHSPKTSSVAILRKAIDGASEGLIADLARSQQVVGDAVGRLLRSFSSIKQVVTSQRALLGEATKDVQAGGTEASTFGGSATALARQYVEDMVRVSRDSVRILDQLDRLGENVSTIIRRADSIERLAKETRLLALNARIETQRAGTAGRTFGVVAEEVKRLSAASAELSEEIRREVGACRNALGDTRRTAESLASHDMTGVLISHKSLSAAIAKLDEVNRVLANTLSEIDASMSGAIQALQFQDVVTQLIEGVSARLRVFSDLTAEAVALVAGPGGGSGEVGLLVERFAALQRGGAVTQTSMAARPVELS